LSQSYVLDTSALLNLIRGKELGQQIDRAFGLRSAMHRHVVSIVTHGELRALAGRNAWGDEKQGVLDTALANVVTLNIDSQPLVEAYVRVEQVCRIVTLSEKKMGHNDMWIAATALVTGLPLITTDKDFSHLHQHLIQVHWVDPQLRGPSL
jgi:tRNA(fMet)-specific endonuclease VapC